MAFLEGFMELLSRLAIVYFMIGLGIVWRFSRLYKPEYGKFITNIIIWVFFPISIISSFADIESFSGEVFFLVVIVAIFVHGISYLSSRLILRKRPLGETGPLVLCTTFPNAFLFPFPIIMALEIPSGLVYASIFVFMAMIFRNTFGVLLGIWHKPVNNNASNSENILTVNYKKLVIDLFKFPPFLAVLAGFLIHSLLGPQAISFTNYPEIQPILEIIKSISLYGSLLLIGMAFQAPSQLHPRKFFSEDIFQVASSRFVIVPLFTIILLFLLPTTPFVAIPLLIQSMAPPAVSNVIYGKFFHFDESEVSFLITSLTLYALLLLPLELFILQILFPFP